MCGITGKVYLGHKTLDPKDIGVMNKKVAHRGPDDTGIFISEDKKLGLGNQRLAVIDLSQNGHMPMQYLNKYEITFNGEIYNFKSLRKDLKRTGYKFRSDSDTEVILALYDRYKTNCLKYLRGMYAFALYDKTTNLLFLARDRIGKKPLKYFFDGNTFIFASELKAILTQPEIHIEVDYEAINQYLTFGYVIPPRTGFQNICKLEPGSYLTLDLIKGKLSKKIYWQPDYSKNIDLSEDEWGKKILQKLEESVKLRMISDVPIGAFLSGGVDSSTVVALMAQNSNSAVKTFTIGFKDKSLDESKYAQNIADQYHTDHHVLIAEPENVEDLPELARIYEEPFADASSVITHMVCKMAKKHVTVVLNGDGGDENFVGYERYARVQRDYLFDKYGTHAKPFLSSFGKVLGGAIKNQNLKRVEKFLHKSTLPFSERYGSYIQYFGNEETMVDHRFNEISKVFANLENIDPRDKALFWDMTRYLPNDLLAKVDIASMAVGLEARSPFLDQDLIDLACKIPFNLKYKGGQYKYILKKAIKEIVPKENIYRRKVGFTIPLDRWFEGSLNSYASSILLPKKSFVQSIFQKSYIQKMLENHSISNDFGPRLWALLSLELWHRSYF